MATPTGNPASAGVPGEAAPGLAARPMRRRTILELGAALVPAVLAAPAAMAWLIGRAGRAASDVAVAATGPSDAVAAGGPAGAPAAEDTAGAVSAPHRWAFAVDVTRCIGCGFCVDACKLENHVPTEADTTRTWVERHAIAADGTDYVDSPEGGIHGFPPESTAPGAESANIEHAFFMPRLCMQCDNPPCVSICPVSATYRTPDGVILVDQDRCIGCGYCVVACPYGARYLVPSGGETPTGNAGVADKCTWCYQRISNGRNPVCVEVCPAGARMFGDLDDPTSTVGIALREREAAVLKPELGTKPKVFYIGLDEGVRS
jgi:tetrathionate reductase subunit B